MRLQFSSLFLPFRLGAPKAIFFLLCTIEIEENSTLKILSAPRSPLKRGPAHSRTVRWTRDLQYVSRVVSSSIAKHRFFFFLVNKIRIDAPHALTKALTPVSVAVRL